MGGWTREEKIFFGAFMVVVSAWALLAGFVPGFPLSEMQPWAGVSMWLGCLFLAYGLLDMRAQDRKALEGAVS